MTQRQLDMSELRLRVLRNLNSLTRLVQDIDLGTAPRDLKNIEKAEITTIRSLAELKSEYDYGD